VRANQTRPRERATSCSKGSAHESGRRSSPTRDRCLCTWSCWAPRRAKSPRRQSTRRAISIPLQWEPAYALAFRGDVGGGLSREGRGEIVAGGMGGKRRRLAAVELDVRQHCEADVGAGWPSHSSFPDALTRTRSRGRLQAFPATLIGTRIRTSLPASPEQAARRVGLSVCKSASAGSRPAPRPSSRGSPAAERQAIAVGTSRRDPGS
jgi:hypothetical protein